MSHLDANDQPDPFEAARTARSLASSRTVREGVLSLPCGEHGAEPGSYCWPLVKGLCPERMQRNFFPPPPRLKVGDLEPLAAATRRARRYYGLRGPG